MLLFNRKVQAKNSQIITAMTVGASVTHWNWMTFFHFHTPRFRESSQDFSEPFWEVGESVVISIHHSQTVACCFGSVRNITSLLMKHHNTQCVAWEHSLAGVLWLETQCSRRIVLSVLLIMTQSHNVCETACYESQRYTTFLLFYFHQQHHIL